MKVLIGLFLLMIASTGMASSVSCTYSIVDTSGTEKVTFTRSSYAIVNACENASQACFTELSKRKDNGVDKYSVCELKADDNLPNRPPFPPSSIVTCVSDLIDYDHRVARSYTGSGKNTQDACLEAERLCQSALMNRDVAEGFFCRFRKE